MSADEKLANKYTTLMDKMTNALGKQDTSRVRVYQDSMLTMIDPSCTVKAPERPNDFYDMQRATHRYQRQ